MELIVTLVPAFAGIVVALLVVLFARRRHGLLVSVVGATVVGGIAWYLTLFATVMIIMMVSMA